MSRLLRFHNLMPLVFVIGMLQYGPSAFESIRSGSVALWTMDSAAMGDSGALRYVKDGFLLFISLIWPLYFFSRSWPREIRSLTHVYVVWVALILCLGSLGIALGYSPVFFWIAGIRWVMLLHASFGIFLIMSNYKKSYRHQPRIIKMLVALGGINALFIIAQYRLVGHIGLGLGASRLTGMFNNAGIAGFFAFSLSLAGACLVYSSLKWRLLLSAICVFIALASGTRSMTILSAIIFVAQFLEILSQKSFRRLKKPLLLLMIPAIFYAGALGYGLLISAVDRGDVLQSQLIEGGRIFNLLNILGVISQADLFEILFGRGLGVGTNTAYSMILSADLTPESYRFNWLIDNAFVTQFFQFGIVGVLIFFGGGLFFIKFVGRKVVPPYRRIFYIAAFFILFIVWAGNPFEHFLLIMPLAMVFGVVYWGSEHVRALRAAGAGSSESP